MMGGMKRSWGVRVDGELLFSVSGPDAEAMARAAARTQGGVVIYSDPVPATPENGWDPRGPWQECT
jgi:hypothetical protein